MGRVCVSWSRFEGSLEMFWRRNIVGKTQCGGNSLEILWVMVRVRFGLRLGSGIGLGCPQSPPTFTFCGCSWLMLMTSPYTSMVTVLVKDTALLPRLLFSTVTLKGTSVGSDEQRAANW